MINRGDAWAIMGGRQKMGQTGRVRECLLSCVAGRNRMKRRDGFHVSLSVIQSVSLSTQHHADAVVKKNKCNATVYQVPLTHSKYMDKELTRDLGAMQLQASKLLVLRSEIDRVISAASGRGCCGLWLSCHACPWPSFVLLYYLSLCRQ